MQPIMQSIDSIMILHAYTWAKKYVNLSKKYSNFNPNQMTFDCESSIPLFHLSTVGHRPFPVAAATLWNILPVDVQLSPSLPVFRQHLKTFLFHKSFPDVVWQADYAFVDLVMANCYFSHIKNFLIDW